MSYLQFHQVESLGYDIKETDSTLSNSEQFPELTSLLSLNSQIQPLNLSVPKQKPLCTSNCPTLTRILVAKNSEETSSLICFLNICFLKFLLLMHL